MEPDIEQINLFYRFGVALVIGFLIGLQREHAFDRNLEKDEDDALFAGTRTYALLGLLGCSGAFIADLAGSPMAFIAIFLVAGALVTVAYFLTASEGGIGLTSEIAAIMVVLIGAFCYWNEMALAAALAVATTVLLAIKLQMQSLVQTITKEDIYATLKFAVITLIILPVLPQQSYGPPPFDVLVPHKIWLMVVFISGISFLGYVLIKVVGTRRGVGLTGLLGGLASSTAVTLSFSQRSRSIEGLAKPFAFAILIAWCVMFIRVMVEVAVINAPLLNIVWIPMTAALVVCFVYCAYLYFTQSAEKQEEHDDFKNPFELGPAITFGLLYAVILLVANAARMYLGDAGVYLSSIASGVADVDAITLSMAELSRDEANLDMETAARAIVLAATSNTIVKGGIVLSTGSKSLRKVILPGLIATLVTAVGVVFLL